MKIRKLMAVLLVLAMVVSFCPAFDLGIEAEAAEPATPVKEDVVFDYIYDISSYRSAGRVDISKKISNLEHVVNNTARDIITSVYRKYPAKEGYVFAGWYSDIKLMKPLGQDVTTGGAFAKFVPEGLIKAVAQVSIRTDHTTEASALRFIAAVDSLDYNQIGFTVTKKGVGAYVHSSTKVYTTLSAVLEGATTVEPTYFNSTGKFMYALTLTGIDNQSQPYTAKPFWITEDGTLVNHVVTGEKTVKMGVNANVAAGKTEIDENTLWFSPSANEYVINTVGEFRAFVEISKTYNFAGKTVKLGADIAFNPGIAGNKMMSTATGIPYLSGVTGYTPVGSSTVPFAGTFDGQGHTISGIASKTGYDGVFAAIDGATIRNLKVARSTMRGGSGGGHSAGLVALSKGTSTIENVYIGADVNLWNASYQGGIVGKNAGNLTVRNSWSAASFNPQWMTNAYIGGVVGTTEEKAANTLLLENCLFTGTMAGTAQGSSFIGGLVGATGNTLVTTLTNCLSAGTMGIVTSTGTLYSGSITGSKSWTAARTVATGVYATEECYSVDGKAQLIRADQSFASGVTAVAKANLYGDLAKTNASALDYASIWKTVNGGVPVLSQRVVDTSWYGDGSASEFTLYTAADLNGFALLCNTVTFSGKTVKLGADIVYNEGDASTWGTTPPANIWSASQSTVNSFQGTFDGQGHTISGLYSKVDSGNAAFIGHAKNAAIKNLRVVNSYFENTRAYVDDNTNYHDSCGIIARANNIAVTNVYTDAILVGGFQMGIVAFLDGAATMERCWFDGTANLSTTYRNLFGGMCGNTVAKTLTTTNCLFTGTVTGGFVDTSNNFYSSQAAGLSCGYGWAVKKTMTNCLIAGDFSGAVGHVAHIANITHNGFPSATYAARTNVYVVGDENTLLLTNPNSDGSSYRTVGTAAGVTVVTADAIKGAAATSVLTNLDYATLWYTRENAVPGLLIGKMDGEYDMDVSWYNSSATEFVLYDAADLYGFSFLQESVNFSGKTVKLGADIVLNEGDAKTWATSAPANVWEPIGKDDASKSFEGTFDGQGHTISGLYYDSALYGGGLFVYTGTQAVIKNLKLTNSYIRSTHGAEWSATSSVAAFVNGTDFINVYSDAIIDTNSGYTGGIGGRLQGSASNFQNCEFAGTITGTGSYANFIGGILGGANTNTAGASSYVDCVFSGNITGNTNIGGLAGRSSGAANSTTTVTGAKITGTVNAYNTTNASNAGGLFGLAEVSTLSVSNTTVSGTVNATLGVGGGFIGMVSTANVTIDSSVFDGTVNGGTKLAGFVGRINTAGYTTTIKNSFFSGAVNATSTSESTAAGFVGHVNNGNVTIQNSVTEGTIVAPGPYAAGAIAQIMNVAGVTISIDGVTSTAAVKCASSNAGGIIGRIMGVNPKVTIANSLANATFTVNSWCTAQVVAHAQSNAVAMTNVIYCVPSGSLAAANPVEADNTKITGSYRKLTASKYITGVTELHKAGMRPDFAGFLADNTIYDVQDLYGFMVATESNDFADQTVTLAADITVNDEATYGSAYTWDQTAPKYGWVPMAFVADNSTPSLKPFAGTFDGQGHTISGIYCAHNGGNGMGLFTAVSGTIQNFRLENSYFENMVSVGYGYNASVTAVLDGGTVSQVYSDAVMKTVDSWAAGIVGMVDGESVITQCQFDGSLMARCNLTGGCNQSVSGADANQFQGSGRGHAVFVGGIAGCLKGTSLELSNCLYTGKIFNECTGAHRTGGIMGGINEGALTMTQCVSAGNYVTLNNTGRNSYHFSMLLDCRGLGGSPVNAETLFQDNYLVSRRLYAASGELINTGAEATGDILAGAQECRIPVVDENGDPVLDAEGNPTYEPVTTIRYADELILRDKMEILFASKTGNMDFQSIWRFNANGVPALRFGDTSNPVDYTYHGVEGELTLFVPMDGVETDTFTDKNIVATDLGKTTDKDEPLFSVEEVTDAPIPFVNIDYSDGAYITKYIGTTLTDYETYIAKLVTFGFKQVASNIINTDDAYYTALSFGNRTYSITYFANTGETYVTVSGQMKHSPFMNETHYQTAVNTEGGEPETRYDDITVTTVELSEGGLLQIIRLKNGHYIVVDGGTGIATVGTTVINQDTGEEYTITGDGSEEDKKIRASRAELAAALGATVRPIYGVDEETGEEGIVGYEDPAIIVDAWIFTHDHNDHAGWLNGGVFGAMQVDVYIKGFYYNFSNTYRVPATVEVGETVDEEGNTVPMYAEGYANQFYSYHSTEDEVDQYTQQNPETYGFWVEYSATHKTAANVNTPSWGKRNIPIYRIQAGQKFYFDGITLEIPYTQDQIQPVEYNGNLNASSAWLLFTDEHGNTYLEAGDTELVNQKAVIELYDDYYDGGEGTNYALFGADVVNGFHHGQNLWVEGDGDYTVVNTIFGICNESGDATQPNTADNANDGRTKLILYTRGYLNSLFGYVADHTSETSRMMQANHYLTGYVYPVLPDASLEAARAFPNLMAPAAFTGICTKPDGNDQSWQGTTTITFNSEGVTWNKQQTESIYIDAVTPDPAA